MQSLDLAEAFRLVFLLKDELIRRRGHSIRIMTDESFTLMKTQDWVEASVYSVTKDICPTISASGVSLSVIMLLPSHAEFFQYQN